MSRRTKTQNHTWKERALSLLLAAALLAGVVPGLTLPASAHWADTYMDQLVDWGVIRADQTGDPDAPITRADFAAIINRAYGYTETGPIPFEDVSVTDWFYDDIAIAYNAGYMVGTSATTASPNETLTREMAVCILGRNMMMKEATGENLAFTDGRDVSNWARGLVKTAVDNYIISGYPDNSFGPQDPISKAQMAVLVTQCIGQPVSQSGTYSLGGVFGNVTITSPDVTLRDTTISGDLYVSGGVGLGGIKLENVNVLGRIIVSSSGESESGEASVVMRNVTAQEMLVDNMRNKTVTVRADGITDIAETTVRTPAYLEDNNTDDKGLMHITMDGEAGSSLTLAGRIKEVTNKTPNSTVQVAKGTVAKLTVDEAAVNSTVQLDRNTEVKELNLDVGTSVTGEGDIDQLNINAPGSVVAMLPDKIYIRPGLNANIAGVIMDHTAAEEGSTDPRLLSGYPAAKDIAPTGFRADFAGNKQGTVYWAVSAIADGSVQEEDLISPPSYGSKAVQNGSVAAPTGGTEVSAQVTGLTTGGSYYLSAILVDGQNRRSPVKVVSFTTPDNTIPAFAQGYPYMSMITDTEAQVTVMPTKTCKMYYAVLPRGAQAPTASDMKSASVTSNLGYGVVDVTKNKEEPFMVSHRLEELKDYTLYLWLSDVDGVNSSAIVPVQFTTRDMTPPEFVTAPTLDGTPENNSVPMTATLNENGTIFWVAVDPSSDLKFPRPHNGYPQDNEDDGLTAKLDSMWAKLQVANGMNCVSSGRVTAQANRPVDFNVTGLQPEKGYDLYYLAQDTAGNYSVRVEKVVGGIHTRDNSKPTVSQSFTSMNGDQPMANTDIILTFSEDVAYNGNSFRDLYDKAKAAGFSETSKAMQDYMDALHNTITLYRYVPGVYEPPRDNRDGPKVYTERDIGKTVGGKKLTAADVVIDFRKAVIEDGEGEGTMAVRFPNSGLRLVTGNRYFFVASGVTDTSTARNPLDTEDKKEVDYNTTARNNLRIFPIALATIQLQQTEVPEKDDDPFDTDEETSAAKPNGKEIDISFYMKPNGTSKVNDDIRYDLLFWSEERLAFDVYIRVVNALDGKPITDGTNPIYPAYSKTETTRTDFPSAGLTGVEAKENGWVYLGNTGGTTGSTLTPYPQETRGGTSLFGKTMGLETSAYPRLNTMEETRGSTDPINLWYEVGLCLTKVGEQTQRPSWSLDKYTIDVNVAAGSSLTLQPLKNPSEAAWGGPDGFKNSGGSSIGDAVEPKPDEPDTEVLEDSIGNTQVPQFQNNTPTLAAEASTLDITVNLDYEGWVYYMVAPVSGMGLQGVQTTATVGGSTLSNDLLFEKTPGKGGIQDDGSYDPNRSEADSATKRYTESKWVSAPSASEVQTPRDYNNPYIKYDTVRYYRGGGDVKLGVTQLGEHTVTGLEADKEYFCYIVLTGLTDPTGTHSETYLYKFKTKETMKPRITPDDQENGKIDVITKTANSETTVAANLKWRVLNTTQARLALGATLEVADTAVKGYGDYSDIKTMTVWDALNMEFESSKIQPSSLGSKYGDYNDYSVFDALASDGQKRELGLLIYSASGDFARRVGNAEGGTRTLTTYATGDAETGPEDYKSTVNWFDGAEQKVNIDEQYVFLVAGHNTANHTNESGTGGRDDYSPFDSYRLRYVINRDSTPPQLTDGIAGAHMGSSGMSYAGGTFSGSIVLTFNKAVYWKEEENATEIYSVQPGNNNTQRDNVKVGDAVGRISILEGVKPRSGSVFMNEGFTTTARQSFEIHFEAIGAVTVGLVNYRGYLCNQSGDITRVPATIQFNTAATEGIVEAAAQNGCALEKGDPYVTVTFLTEGHVDAAGNPVTAVHYIKAEADNTDKPSLSLNPTELTLYTDIATSKTKTITANIHSLPAGAQLTRVSWTGFDETLVSVTPDTTEKNKATVTALKPGTTTIKPVIEYTRADGVPDSYQSEYPVVRVTVKAPSVKITPQSANINKGGTVTLNAEITDGDPKTLTWTSSDNKIATVDSTGKVTGVEGGPPVTITATYSGTSTVRGTATVNVAAPSITVDPPIDSIQIGGRAILKATASNGASGDEVTWSSNAELIATVDQNGVVTGVSYGTATITATYAGKTATATIYVEPKVVVVEITNENIVPNPVNNGSNQTYHLKAKVTVDGKDSSAAVVWKTSDATIATIDKDGNLAVIGKEGDKFTITATCNDYVSASTTLTEDSFTRTVMKTVTITPSSR